MGAARKIIAEALALPTGERARVAAALIASLDEREDRDVEEVSAAEIERRADRVLAGESRGAPWEEVRERLLARLKHV